MKVLLDIKDDKAKIFMDMLKGVKFVKTTTLTEPKAQFLEDLKEAVEELKLIKAGKKRGRPARELLNEL